MGAAEALGGLRQNVLGGALCIGEHLRVPEDQTPVRQVSDCCVARASGQFRIDAVPHVANVARLAALANPPPTQHRVGQAPSLT